MGNVKISRQSEKPYYISQIGMNIYSIEELAYYLYNYLPMVEISFFTNELADYIERVLELKAVARRMRELLGTRATLSDYVMLLVKAANYFNEQELLHLQRLLEEQKTRKPAVHLFEKAQKYVQIGQHAQALMTFQLCLKKTDMTLDHTFYGNLYYEMGCLYGRMLQFDNACRSFLEAYRLYPQVRIKEKYIYLHLIWDRREALLSHMEQLDISDALLRECEQSYRQTLDQSDLAYDDRVTVADMKVQYRKENGYH